MHRKQYLNSLLCCCLNLETSKCPSYNSLLLKNSFIPLHHSKWNNLQSTLMALSPSPSIPQPSLAMIQHLPFPPNWGQFQGKGAKLPVDCVWLGELPRDPMFGTKQELRLTCTVWFWQLIYGTTWKVVESTPALIWSPWTPTRNWGVEIFGFPAGDTALQVPHRDPSPNPCACSSCRTRCGGLLSLDSYQGCW